ncbi:MAG: hypothetical protein IPH18_10980 [Chitinophagaceae bacterium]|nr:hypothetical protein [Chitinophagaceae bacterium]
MEKYSHNQHKLAAEFVLLDNFYVDGEVVQMDITGAQQPMQMIIWKNMAYFLWRKGRTV